MALFLMNILSGIAGEAWSVFIGMERSDEEQILATWPDDVLRMKSDVLRMKSRVARNGGAESAPRLKNPGYRKRSTPP
jgi:hypothetical protein